MTRTNVLKLCDYSYLVVPVQDINLPLGVVAFSNVHQFGGVIARRYEITITDGLAV